MDTNMTWSEALVEYGLDFKVEKRPLQAILSDGSTKPVNNLFSMVRSDTGEPLSGVGVRNRYSIIQTQCYADIGNKVCGELGAEFVNGGLLKNGNVAYLQAKLPDSIRIKGTDDTIDKMLTFVNSFDGSTNFMVMPTGFRIFCHNQMSVLKDLSRNKGLSIRHTNNAKMRIAQTHEAIMEVMNAYNTFEEKVNWLADQTVTNAQVEQVVKALFEVEAKNADEVHTRTRNSINRFRQELESGPGIESFQGSALSLWHAATGFNARQRTHRLNGRNKRTVQFQSNLLGSGFRFERRAMGIVEQVLAA